MSARRSRLIGACLLISGAVVCALMICRGNGKVSLGLIGLQHANWSCEAVVGLTNKTVYPIRCEGVLACRRLDRDQQLELGRFVSVRLEPRKWTNLTAPVPWGSGPARVSCSVTILHQHPALVRQIGARLQKFGIHLYHPPSPPVSVVNGFAVDSFRYASAEPGLWRFKLGGRATNGSLSDWLLLQRYTNSWDTP